MLNWRLRYFVSVNLRDKDDFEGCSPLLPLQGLAASVCAVRRCGGGEGAGGEERQSCEDRETHIEALIAMRTMSILSSAFGRNSYIWGVSEEPGISLTGRTFPRTLSKETSQAQIRLAQVHGVLLIQTSGASGDF